ncbi:uncharacterized protein LOC143292853 [Babylonia areolata]|uniref:uncharacterized protein LOC143292853 n=1 Tax=Babylonia areolata TaxID=304850 RepID=UPI003FD2ADB1
MDLPGDDHDARIIPAAAQHDHLRSDGVISSDDVTQDTQEVEMAVGQRDYDEGALCQIAEKGGLTLKGQINMGSHMTVTHHNFHDNRTVTKHVHHQHGDMHQHTVNKYIKEGDVIHHHGDVHQSHHVHYTNNDAGYAQIKDQSDLEILMDQKVFVETWAFRTALQRVTSTGLLLVTGPPDCGKTCLAHALLRHHKALGYTPLVLHRFEEWRAHVGGDRQQVILLEDIFGKDQFRSSSYLEWVHAFSTIQQLAASGKCVIIITVNDIVLDTVHAEHGSCSLLSHALNLASSDACLSEDEKRAILGTHLKQAGRSISNDIFEEVVQSVNKVVLFPVQCKLFSESPLDEREALKVFTSGTEDALGICGTGPKVFFNISPDIIKKCLLKPTQKVGRWGHCFTNTRSDIIKTFQDNDWTTGNIQRFVNTAGMETTHGSTSGHMIPIMSTCQKPEEEAGTDGREAILPFEAACWRGDSKMILEMIESASDVLSSSDKNGFTPLHVATLAGQAHIVELLLNRDCPVDAVDKQGWTPLHVACHSGHTHIARLLVKHGAKLELDTCFGMRALHIACRYGYTDIVQLLLENGAVTEARPNTGFLAYPLHVAAFYGHADTVQLLVKFKAQTNVTDRGGWLPLHYACQEGHLKVVEILLSANAATSSHARQNLQLSVSCQNGHSHLVRSLLQCGLCTHDPQGKTTVCRSCYLTHQLPLENLSRHQTYPGVPAKGNITALYLAAQNGHCGVVHALLKAGACTEVKTSGMTPLLVASYKGHQHIVKLLLQYKSDVNDSLENVLWTSLHLASANGHRETVEILLQHGAIPDARDNYGISPLHRACIHGHSNVLPSLLARVKELYTDEKSAGKLLSLASEYGSIDVISSLQEWIPNIFEIAKKSPVLHVACRTGNLEVVKTLLEHGFPVNQVSDASEYRGLTPIHVASSNGHAMIVEALIKHAARADEKTPYGDTTLHLACRDNRVEVVRVLLQKGSADIEMTEGDGQTPLHIAADKGFDDIVTLLVASNANVNAQDSKGQTPLICGRCWSFVVDLLLENNADASMTTVDGETILHRVCSYGTEDILGRLVHKVHLETKDKNGETALLRACRAKKNRHSKVTLLLENGADAEAADEQGVTPMQIACSSGDVDLLRELLKHGGSVNSHNKNGETPLHQACVQGHSHLVEVLLQAGAFVNEPDHDGNTPLHKACIYLQPDSVKVLLEHGANFRINNKNGLSAMTAVQSMNLTDVQFCEEERRQKSDKRMEIMFAFMEFQQRFTDNDDHTAAHNTVCERSEGFDQTESANYCELSSEHRLGEGVQLKVPGRMTETDMERNGKKKESRKTNAEKKAFDSCGDVTERGEDGNEENCITRTANKTQTLETDGTDNSTSSQEANTEKRTTDGLKISRHAASVSEDPSPVESHELPDKHDDGLCGNLNRTEHDSQTRESVQQVRNICSVQNDHAPKALSVSQEEPSSLQQACFQGNTDLVLHHLLTCSNVDAVSDSGRTALHCACVAGHHDIAALLLQHGANPAQQDTMGRACLHEASLRGHLCTVDLLLAQGTDVNTADSGGRTALHLASSQGHALVAALLLRHGAEVNFTDDTGNTPLMLACAGSHADVSVILLNWGAGVESRNSVGEAVRDVVKCSDTQVLGKVLARHSVHRPRASRPPRQAIWCQWRLFGMAFFAGAFLACVAAVCLTWF